MGLLVLLFVISMPGIVVAPSPIAANPHGGTVPFRATGAPGGFTLSGSVGSIEISLHNTMNVSTGTYQQPVFINSSADARWINANWSNGIAYYPSNDTPIYGWLESNATNTANSTLLWLRLDAIPAGGWTNVSIAFWPKSSFELSATGYMGEAPELSAQYAEFDNGASVFNFYDDFNGTTLASHWTGSTGWTYRVDDGFSVDSVPGSGSGIYSRSPYNSYPAVVDFYGDLYQTTSATHFVSEGLGTSACTGCYTAEAVAWAATGATYSGPSPQAAYFGSENFGTSAFSTQQAAVFTTEAVSSTEAIYEVNYTAAQTLTSNLPPGPLPVALAIAGYSPGLLTNNESTTWIRERTYVPFLPTVNVSAIQYPVTGAETGLPAGTPWWLNVTNGTSHLSRTPTFSFNESNGTYAYTVGTTNKTFAAPGGTFDVTGGPLVVPVTFHPVTYPVNFTETGLPP
ncbi:MAG TPA: hypothetical protein VGS23_08100, partial [Thermoplasmata archaeon]|nr:hypothetical protein [Thermoplasmata archaeon]